MPKPRVNTSIGPNRKRSFAKALAGPHTRDSFAAVYDAPGQIRQARSAGRPAQGLGQARGARKTLANALLEGHREGLFKAYEHAGLQQGDLAQALTTLKTAKASDNPDLMSSDLVKRARRIKKTGLGIRSNFLQSQYLR